jgi:hypothetical protein
LAECAPAEPAFRIRGDTVVRVVHYWSCDRASADLGLTPKAGYSGSAP